MGSSIHEGLIFLSSTCVIDVPLPHYIHRLSLWNGCVHSPDSVIFLVPWDLADDIEFEF